MSDLTPRLPDRPSLEQLRRQAKELVRQFHAGDASADQRFRACSPPLASPDSSEKVPLANAQFVLAREHGFESWTKLKRHVEAARHPSLDQYERVAEDVLSAYRTGDSPALRRLNDLYQGSVTWDRIRSMAHERLGAEPDPATGTIDFALADARLFIAKQYGFENWTRFAESIVRPKNDPRSDPLGLGGSLPFYKFDPKKNRIEPRPPLSSEDWDAVIGVMKERRISGLSASGQMNDGVLERLSKLDHVTRLELGGSKGLTDEGLQLLTRMPQLQHLNLSGSGITDRGLVVLRELNELKTFRLHHHREVSDVGIAHLKDCERLEEVDLMGTRTGDGAIAALAGKPQLCHFLAGSEVTDAGLALFQMYPAFKSWQGEEPEMALMSFDAGSNILWLNLKAPFTDQGLASLAGLDGLISLTLFGTTGMGVFDDSDSTVTAAGVGRLADLANLRFLGCCARLGNDESLRHIGAMPRLRALMCQDAVSGDAGFEALSRSKTVEYIWGRRCHNLTGRGFAAMAAMPALRGLSVSCKNVDNAGLSALPRFPELLEFMPMDVPDDGFRHVGGCEQLEALWCMYCNDTSDTATGHIAPLSKLKTYYANKTQITDKSLEILGRIQSLEKIILERCMGLTDAGLPALAALPRLREITLFGMPDITRKGAAVFPADVIVDI